MGVKRAKIVIIGAGMAGLVAANKLQSSPASGVVFEVVVVEGGSRIGGRIRTSEFGGDRIEMGATWIHGIGGSPVHKIAQAIGGLESPEPWERMDGFPADPVTVAEGDGGRQIDSSLVDSISSLYLNLMQFAKEKSASRQENGRDAKICAAAAAAGCDGSVGTFLRRGLDAFWSGREIDNACKIHGDWTRESIEESLFAMHANTERTYTSSGDLYQLDFDAEREYEMFPGEEITIAKGYTSVIDALASLLPAGLIQLRKKVVKIQWRPAGLDAVHHADGDHGPVTLHFADGSTMAADHVIITVSLGVLKAGIQPADSLFTPPLPLFKRDAISRLGFGVVDKLFLQLDPDVNIAEFPFLQFAFHQKSKSLKQGKIPWWMRKTASLCPIYKSSNVLLAWFAGDEALHLESLENEEISNGVTATLSSFTAQTLRRDTHNCTGSLDDDSKCTGFNFSQVLKTGWGTDPLFLGSYSFVAVGSSGDDFELLTEPLPRVAAKAHAAQAAQSAPSLQLLFAGEATDRTHYSTTHGAYLSGLREANRLLQHYSCYPD